MKSVIFLIFLSKFIIDAKVPQLDGRIIGGVDTNITEFPYQVSLRLRNAHICGGSIFHHSFVVTAAHCVTSGSPARSFSIRAGSNILNSGGTLVQVCSINVHQNYSTETMENDIAILKLCSPLILSDSILPITLANSKKTPVSGTAALISGWGFTKEEGGVSLTLKKVEVPIITNARCQSLYPDEILSNGMLCAGYLGLGKKDACQGDSGGPLRANGRLIGIVSWGYGCARPLFPGVYTNVAMYRSWIKTITNY